MDGSVLNSFRQANGIINPSALIRVMNLRRKLKPYQIIIKPSDIVRNKAVCTEMLETVEKECPEPLFFECIEVVSAFGNLDSSFNIDYGDAKENAISSYFFRRLHRHNPMIQDTLDMIRKARKRPS